MAVNFSSSKLGQNRIAELDERIRKLKFPNLFLEVKELKANNKLPESLLKKLLTTQKSIQKYESELFSRFPFHENLWTVLCHFLDQHNEDDDDDDEVSSFNSYEFPQNITASLIQFHRYVSEEDVEEAEKIVEYIEQKYEDPECKFELILEEVSARVDVAYLYHQLDPMLYCRSIEHYEASLQKAAVILAQCSATTKRCDVTEMYMEALHVWQYYLLVTYNRLLNAGFLCIQEDASTTVRSREACFERICELGKEILTTKHVIPRVITARTLTELYDAHFKMKFELRENGCCCTLCTMLCEEIQLCDFSLVSASKNKCNRLLSVALDMKPDDGHILEKIGRLKRVTAQSEEHLHEAKAMLEKCVTLYPTRHVAWHQLGIIYRSLWLYPEHKEFYSNPVRCGYHKKKNQRKNKKSENDLFCAVAEEMARLSTKDSTIDSAKKETKSQTCTDIPSASGETPPPCEEKESVKQQILPKSDVLKSWNPTQDKLPRHTRKIDWFDRFRSENPLIAEKDVPEFVKKAQECFAKANDIVNGTGCRLWVDMGRLHISMHNFKKAEKCFTKAKKCSAATLHDKSYLYEQWGLFTHENLTQRELGKAKSLYRHAIEYSVRSYEKSKIAFYNLKDILQEQLKSVDYKSCNEQVSGAAGHVTNQEKLSLEKEYALLQKLVKNFSAAKAMLCEIMSRERFKGQKDLRNLAWDLVDVFAETGCFEDAWCYINSNLIYTAEKKHHKLILDVCFGLANQLNVIEPDGISDDQSVSENRNILSMVFRYLSHPSLKRTASEGTVPEEHVLPKSPHLVSRSHSESNIYPREAYDVFILTDDGGDEPSGFAMVRNMLRQCGLSVKCEDDILPGSARFDVYGHFIEYARMVIIFTDRIMSEEKRELYVIAQSIVYQIATTGWQKTVVYLQSDEKDLCDLPKQEKVQVIETSKFLDAEGTPTSQKYAFIRKLFETLCS